MLTLTFVVALAAAFLVAAGGPATGVPVAVRPAMLRWELHTPASVNLTDRLAASTATLVHDARRHGPAVGSRLASRGLFSSFRGRRGGGGLKNRPVLDAKQIRELNDFASYGILAFEDPIGRIRYPAMSDLYAPSCKRLQGMIQNIEVIEGAFGTLLYVAETRNGGDLIVSFRGRWKGTPEKHWEYTKKVVPFPTEHVSDLQPLAQKKIQAHSGWLDRYMVVRHMLIKEIERRVPPRATWTAATRLPRIHFVGLSTGGALAHLAAYDFATSPLFRKDRSGAPLFAHIKLVTFGAPRVGNAAFANALNAAVADTVRVVEEDDLIPHLPPRIAGFRHAAGEVYAHNGVAYACDRLAASAASSSRKPAHKGKSKVAPVYDEDAACSDSRAGLFGLDGGRTQHSRFLGRFLGTLKFDKDGNLMPKDEGRDGRGQGI